MLDKFYAWILHQVTERYHEELHKIAPTSPMGEWSPRSLKVMKMIEYANSIHYDLRGMGNTEPDKNGDYFDVKLHYNGRNKEMKKVQFEVGEIMKMTPEDVAQVQHTALKEHAINTLMNVVKLIEAEDYEAIDDVIKWSPSGGEQGTDKHFIDFTYDPLMKEEGTDISHVLDELLRLKRRCEL